MRLDEDGLKKLIIIMKKFVADKVSKINASNIKFSDGDTYQDKLDKGDLRGGSGWTPLFSIVVDGDKRVLKIADWTGGVNKKPTTGQYLGSNGLVNDIALAVDIGGGTFWE